MVDRIEQTFELLPDDPRIYEHWKRLVTMHQISGNRAFDARLVDAVSARASRQAAQGRQQPRSIVVTVADAPKGQVPLGFLVLKAGVARPAADVEREAVALVRERIVPVASFKAALVVAGLPKTRSGKILRSTMRKIAEGEDYPLPATIDDPAILVEIERELATAGYAKR